MVYTRSISMPEYPGELHWTWKTTGHSSMVSETFQVLNAFRIPGTGNHEEHGYHEFIHDPGITWNMAHGILFSMKLA